MYYHAPASMREAGSSLLASHHKRRGRSYQQWRWFAPLFSIALVTWVGCARYATTLGSLQSERTDFLVVQPQPSPAGRCDARLAAVLLPGSDSSSSGGAGAKLAESPGSRFTSARRKLYQAMEDSLGSQGLRLGGGEHNHQGLQLSDLFRMAPGSRRLQAVLTPLDVPVRAVVIPFADPKVSSWLHDALLRHLGPIIPEGGMWVQNHALYHSTVFHASTHAAPVPASQREVLLESEAITSVAARSCPLHAVLERIVATPSGTVLACWQVARGTDPAQLRHAMRGALPGAPAQQVVTDEAILHTTLARVVIPPRPEGDGQSGSGSGDGSADSGGSQGGAAALALQRAVQRMTEELCGVEALLDKLWFVEERDRLALALEGRFTRRAIPLQCRGPQQHEQRGTAAAPGQHYVFTQPQQDAA